MILDGLRHQRRTALPLLSQGPRNHLTLLVQNESNSICEKASSTLQIVLGGLRLARARRTFWTTTIIEMKCPHEPAIEAVLHQIASYHKNHQKAKQAMPTFDSNDLSKV